MFYRKQLRELELWRASTSRKPLIIRGARQVGKTTLINEFGKQFKQYISLNLEREKDAQFFQTNDDINTLIEKIFIEKRMLLNEIKQTLLFIDEIQEIPKVINLLRYFKEDLPELAVVAAGSMLETLMGKNLTFPVGRVEYRVLRPLSFEEFLIAMGEDLLLKEFNAIPLSKNAERALLQTFHTYALVGGMPEIIQHYQKHKDITALSPIYDALINSYLEDAEKYAKNAKQLQLIRFCIHQAMNSAGKRTSFQRFGNANYSATDIREVLVALEKTHLLHVLFPVTSPIVPLEPDKKKTPRIQFLDSGMINYFLGIQKDIIGTKDLSSIYQGTLIEHLVGQELLSFQTLSLKKLYFWVRHKKQSDAEIDYLYPYQGKLIPIEVKSGATGRLRSLQVFMDQSPLHFAVRFYAGTRQVDKLKTRSGKTFYLLSLPYFLVGKIEQYIKWLLTQISASPEETPQMLEEAKEPYKRIKKKTKKRTLSELTNKHFKLLSLCIEKPQKGKTLLEKGLNLTYQSRNKRVYLTPLMELGLLSFTIKDNEKSKEQRYQITEKGKTILKDRK